MRNITEEIVPLAFIALCAFLIWGLGYLIDIDMNLQSELKSECIAAGKQVIEGNCIDSGN